jgi:putative tricarboxylic transport membrane protein
VQPTRLSSSLSYLLLSVAGVVAVVMALQLGLWRDGSPGPGLFPFLVSCAMVVLGAIGIVTAMLRDHRGKAGPAVPVQGWLRVAIYMIALLVYAGSIEYIGFYVATTLVLAVILTAAENLSWRITLPVIAGTLIFVNVVFVRWLDVYFPSGSLWYNFF